MDNRIALSNSSLLLFPSMTVRIESEIGRGSNSIVYRGTYPDLHNEGLHHVLVKELFPLHPQSSVYRKDDGAICFEGAEEFFEFHRSSFEMGNRVHLGLLERSPDGVGGNINTFVYNNTLYTVLNYNGGRSLEAELAANTHTLEDVVRIVKGILHSLGDFHRNGFLHLDIAPDNIMLLGSGERERVMLIDYNSAMGKDSAEARFSVKQGYSSPEVQGGEISDFSESSDLYSVAAVFIRMIRDYALMPFEMAQRTPPSVSECKMLQDLPETVVSMVRQILFKGLAVSTSRRYSSIEEMLEAFEELEDRIKGVGITHWAIWEAGKRTVNHLIKNNTALHYLKDGEELFPISAEAIDGKRASIDGLIDELMKGQGGNLFVTAPGGMGKTTSMLYTLKRASARYTPAAPAIIYVSLHGSASAKSSYITDKILENLQFKSDVQSYADARHALHQLFSRPLIKGGMPYSSAVLFLDGLNEVSEGIEHILSEISALSKLEGIRIYVTSRTEYELEGFNYHRISPLSLNEEREILTRNHLLIPDSASMQELLRTPIMLSMFIELSRNSGTQPSAKTAEELMDAYLSALIEKEVESLPEDSPLRLKIDVAVKLVLPRIAARIEKNGSPSDDTALFKETAVCYKLIRSPLLIKAFPQWIGHKRAILDQTESADDWYNVIVRELLWRRLGLLIRNEQGRYLPIHQIVGEYLADKQTVAKKRIARYRAIKYSINSAICAVLAAAIVIAFVLFPRVPREEPPVPYNTELSGQILTSGAMAYQLSGYQYEYIRALVDELIRDPSSYQTALVEYDHNTSALDALQSFSFGGSEPFVSAMLESGEVFPWSEHSLEKEEYLKLIALTEQNGKQYAEIVKVIDHTVHNGEVFLQYGAGLLRIVSDLIELDADITATLYAISCREPVEAMIDAYYLSDDPIKNHDAETISHALTANSLQNKHLPSEDNLVALNNSLKTLSGQREDLYYELQSQGAYIIYLSQAGE